MSKKLLNSFVAFVVSITVIFSCMIVSSAIPDEKSIAELNSAKKSSIYFGDVDYDSAITSLDALYVLQASVGKRTFNEFETKRAIVSDGETISSGDALLILQKSVGKISMFPANKTAAEELLDTKVKLKFREDGTFNLLQVSDLQDNCNSNPSDSIKPGTVQRLEAMIEVNDPDLVIFTGDQIWPNGLTDESYFIRYVDKMVKKLESEGIAWGIVFGNHDSENSDSEHLICNVSRARQMEIYESYDHCVAVSGDSDIFGVGNYVVPILSNDESRIEFNVWCLDTGDYTANIDKTMYDYSNKEYYSSVGKSDKYDFIKYDQQLWYYNTSTILEQYNGGQKITGAMFGHICLPEFTDVYNNRDLESVNYTGLRKEGGEACSSVNSHMFDTILARGDVKGFYAGHDHMNTYSGIWKGIELGYAGALTSDMYGSYNTNLPSPETQGGRLITIKQGENGEAATYTSKFVSYDSIKDAANVKKTTSIGNAPFVGDVISMESGTLPAYRAKGFNESPFDVDCISAPTLSVAPGKGFKNGNALAICKDGDKNVSDTQTGRIDNCCIGVKFDKTTTVGANSYMRVWVDFTGVDFRKASFGLVGSNGTVYTTDYKDNSGTLFYYLPEGSEKWKTLNHGSDGCFGVAENSSVADFKGKLFGFTCFFNYGQRTVFLF